MNHQEMSEAEAEAVAELGDLVQDAVGDDLPARCRIAVSLAYYLELASSRPGFQFGPPGQEILPYHMINPVYLAEHRKRLKSIGIIPVELRNSLAEAVRRVHRKPKSSPHQLVWFVCHKKMVAHSEAAAGINADLELMIVINSAIRFARLLLAQDENRPWE